jgi:hypothetical protein
MIEGETGTAGTTLLEFDRFMALAPNTTAVSLHAHTNCSREVMTPVPPYLARIPVVAPMARREMYAYRRRHGEPVDFAKGWWQPPVAPEAVLASEVSQITRTLGLRPIVSITDHDSIDAGLALNRTARSRCLPLSLEWTVPCDHGFFHLGVHNLRPASAVEIYRALAAYTRRPDATCLPGLLETLHADPETLVILNHPLWDLAGIGSTDHVSLLRRFLVDHGERIHALELNGYRSWKENVGVSQLAAALSLPMISGGDRHGCAPNTLLNLTTATSFGDFSREVRESRRSAILVMPEYRRALVARKLAVAADATRHYPSHPSGQRHWTDRVSYEHNGVVRPLSDRWPGGGPLWIRSAMRAFQLATSAPVLPLLCTLVWLVGASTSGTATPSDVMDAVTDSSGPSASCDEIVG